MRSRSRSNDRVARRGVDNYKRGRSLTPPEQRRYEDSRTGGRDRWADERGYRDERTDYRRRDDSRERNRRGDSRERRRDERTYDRRDEVSRRATTDTRGGSSIPSLPQIAVAQPPPPPPPPSQTQQQQHQQIVPAAPAPAAPSYAQQTDLLDWHNATQVYDALCKTDELLPPGWECVVYKGVPVYLDHLSREAFEDKPWEVWARKSSKAAASSAGSVGTAAF
jgi:hypothetical protein